MKTYGQGWSDAVNAAVEECQRIVRTRKEMNDPSFPPEPYAHMATLLRENLWRSPLELSEKARS